MVMRKELACNKCCRKIRVSRVIIINKKLVCPYCYRTIETNKSKVEFIETLMKTLNKSKEEER